MLGGVGRSLEGIRIGVSTFRYKSFGRRLCSVPEISDFGGFKVCLDSQKLCLADIARVANCRR